MFVNLNQLISFSFEVTTVIVSLLSGLVRHTFSVKDLSPVRP